MVLTLHISLAQVDDLAFTSAFGAGKEQLPLLVEKKTVTINRLMELVPEGTTDPTPFVYNDVLMLCAGVCSVAWVMNQTITPLQSVGVRDVQRGRRPGQY